MRTLVDDALRPVLVQTTVTRIMTLLAPFKMWCSSSSTETLRQCFQIFPPKPHFLSCMNGKLNSLWILLAPAQIQNACGLKWQMIGCYCRGWWGLPAEPPGAAAAASLQGMVAAVYTEHTLPAPSPLPLPAPPPPPHHHHCSRGSQPGQPWKPQGYQIHTSPCLCEYSLT